MIGNATLALAHTTTEEMPIGVMVWAVAAEAHQSGPFSPI